MPILRCSRYAMVPGPDQQFGAMAWFRTSTPFAAVMAVGCFHSGTAKAGDASA